MSLLLPQKPSRRASQQTSQAAAAGGKEAKKKNKTRVMVMDVETTGLPRDRHAAVYDLANWPRIVQIAWEVYDQDGRYIKGRDLIIKPEGYGIPAESTRIHGISEQQAVASGVPLQKVLREFVKDLEESDVLVAHNMKMDMHVVGAEMLRMNMELDPLLLKKKVCTQKASRKYCKLPGVNGYKYPGLTELHQALFRLPFRGVHDAKQDAKATSRCFFAMLDKKLIEV